MLYGWTICNEMVDTPHLLIAGTTGSGKSVLLNSIIQTLLSNAQYFHLIDLKRVELSRYKHTRSCLSMTTEPEMVIPRLQCIIDDMEARYQRMERQGKVLTDEPDIYVIIDELADLVSDKRVLEPLTKIGRLGRAAKIHLICATQDPSRRTLEARLVQNFTCRVALRCMSSIESRQILHVPGAELLPQYGYGIMWDARGTRRIEIPFTPDNDIQEMINYRTQ